MSMPEWLRELLYGSRTARVEEAEKRTEEVAETARELTRKLEPYKRELDPFQALMVDLYNRRIEIMQTKAGIRH